MRLKFHCQNRIGILRDIVAHFSDYGLNVARGEVGGEHGNAIYLHVPNLLQAQLVTLRPALEAVPGVFGVRQVNLMPSERRHLELDALLSSLSDPVMSIDMEGHIVAANRAGIDSAFVRRPHRGGYTLAAEPTYELDSLDELLAVC